MVPPYRPIPAASAIAALRSTARGPPFLAIFRANTGAAPSRARWKASSTLSMASSAMIGAPPRLLRRARPTRLWRAMGCSIRAMPLSPSVAQARWATPSSQAWLTSTRTLARSPRARLMAIAWATSASTSPAPIFSLKCRWRRRSSIRPASSMSRPVSPLARVQATSRLSCRRPPSSSLTARPRRLPWASSKAVSTAERAKVLPLMCRSRRCIAAFTLSAGWPSSNGAKCASRLLLMLSGLSLP